jgi:hypothetical protein
MFLNASNSKHHLRKRQPTSKVHKKGKQPIKSGLAQRSKNLFSALSPCIVSPFHDILINLCFLLLCLGNKTSNELKGKMGKSTIVFEILSIPFSMIDRKIVEKSH